MIAIGAGDFHSFAMNKDNLYSWGLNGYGQAGLTKDLDENGDESDVHAPTIVPGLENFGKVIQIAGGNYHTIALTDKGEVLTWGRIDGCQCGIDIANLPPTSVISVMKDSKAVPRALRVPTQVPGLDGASVAAGTDHNIVITKQGKAYAWGFSTNYQTGLGVSDDVKTATLIDNTAVREKKLVSAGAGGQFSVIAGNADYVAPTANGTAGEGATKTEESSESA